MAFKRVIKKDSEEYSITGTDAFYSEAQEVGEVSGYCYQITHTGEAELDADITAQGSNDEDNWADLASKTVAVTGTAGTAIIDVSEHNFTHTRLKVEATAGTGELTIVSVFRSTQE